MIKKSPKDGFLRRKAIEKVLQVSRKLICSVSLIFEAKNIKDLLCCFDLHMFLFVRQNVNKLFRSPFLCSELISSVL